MPKKYLLSSYFWFQHLLNTIPKSQKLYLLTLFNWPELSFLLTNVKNEGKERRPSMVSHTCNLCSALNPSKWTHTAVRSEETHTHTHTHTHCEHTPGAVGSQCCGARGAVGGSVPYSRVSPQSWYWRWRECWTFTPLLIPRLEPMTFRLQVRLSNH